MLQCERSLWRSVHAPVQSADDPARTHIFEVGNVVGRIARVLLGPGVLVDTSDGLAAAERETRAMLAKNEPAVYALFEATLSHDGLLVQVDVLRRYIDGWEIIEVKSSTSVKDEHVTDCAIQCWVLRANGLDVRKVSVAHIDPKWTYREAGNFEGLIKTADVSGRVAPRVEEVSQWVQRGQDLLGRDEPPITIGGHCRKPYQCEHLDHCGRNDSRYPVHDLPRANALADKLFNQGVKDIRDVPDERLNARQVAYKAAIAEGRAVISETLRDALDGIRFPTYFLDFETLSLAIPHWLGTKPFEQVPFQWSCHVMRNARGDLEHFEYLAEGGSNPRHEFLLTMLEVLGDDGPIIVYSSFEKTILNQCLDVFPQHSDQIRGVIARLVDLLPMVRNGYIHPDLKGSWSIKSVLPTLTNEVSYKGADVADGGAAQRTYYETLSEPNAEIKKAKRANLLEYCKTDTLAMVCVVNGFK